jgi:RNA polymerase sigma-70 factor, ECF subfamily
MTDSRSRRSETGLSHLDRKAVSEIRVSETRISEETVIERARAAWPQFQIKMDRFAAHLSSVLDHSLPLREALEQLAIEDLYLAYACSENDAAALKSFARNYDEELRAITAKLRISSSEFDDIRQGLWNKLFLSNGNNPPAILKYGGRGQLRHWFRVLATRSILDEVRRAKSPEALQLLSNPDLNQAAAEADPELANIRHQYEDTFRVAFEKAVNALDSQERNLLKCHYIRGMSTDQLARAFGMHKATAARHVIKAREKLLEFTRFRLKAELGASSSELDSVMRLFDGEMSVSFSRLLK